MVQELLALINRVRQPRTLVTLGLNAGMGTAAGADELVEIPTSAQRPHRTRRPSASSVWCGSLSAYSLAQPCLPERRFAENDESLLSLALTIQRIRSRSAQGYLAHKKAPPPRNLQKAYAYGPTVLVGGGAFLISEVPLYRALCCSAGSACRDGHLHIGIYTSTRTCRARLETRAIERA